MTEQSLVAPAIVVDPSFREWLIQRYAEIADAERELCRPEIEQYARDQIARLEFGGELTLASLLETEAASCSD